MSSYVVNGYWVSGYAAASDLLQQDYASLITSEHVSKPNFMAMIAATVAPAIDLNLLYQEIPYLYDLDTATGKQLDVIGIWVGVGRTLSVPITKVYFSFDSPGLGFDQGIWLGPFDNASSLTSLPDSFYRALLKVKIVNNHWNGSKAVADSLLISLFASETFYPCIMDNTDLSMIIGLAGNVSDTLSQAMLAEGLLDVKPAGVSISYMIPSSAGSFFGFDQSNVYVKGFDLGSWGVSNLPYIQSAGYQLDLNFVLDSSTLL